MLNFTALAQIAPLHDANPSEEATFFYLFFGSVVVLLGFIIALIVIANYFRRKPPIEAEFPTKQEMHSQIEQLRRELQHVDKRNEELFRSIFGKMDALTNTVNNGFQDLHRSLGKLEGRT